MLLCSIATVGGHIIYRIEDTQLHHLSIPSNKPINPDESKYLKAFMNVDLSSNFYFRCLWPKNK